LQFLSSIAQNVKV